MTTILFVESGSGNGGSAVCLANLLQFLDRSRFRPIVAYYADGVNIQRIRASGVETVPLTPGRRTWQLLRVIRRRQVRLLHNNNELASHLPTLLAAALTRVPCVVSLRATRALTRRERFWVPLVRRFLAVSEATRQAYVAAGIPEGQIETMLDGIDVQRFAPSSNGHAAPPGIALAPGRLTVGFVSRLIPEKGVAELLRAAGRIVPQLPQVRFLLIGGDPSERHLPTWQRMVQEMRLGGHVEFTGWRKDLEALTPCFDVAVQASKYWEGWGMSLLEAMACTKPVVATRIGGVPEVVEDGVTGLLVEPGDEAALAEALLRLLKDAALRRQMGEAGRRRAVTLFDQRDQVKRMEALYERILEVRA